MASTPLNIASGMTPSFSMVRKYFVAAAASFLVLCIGLTASYSDIHGHHFQPRLLALTHIATLGWITMIIFGAMYQLIPVVLEVKLYSELLAELQFWIFTAGVVGLAYGFWRFSVGMHLAAAAGLVLLAMIVFVFNVLATMAKVTQWNITGLFLLTSVVYLLLTGISGFLLSINLGFPFIGRIHLDYLKMHAHLGFIGWVTMVVMGVSLKLIPMFGLSHDFPTAPSKYAYAFLNLGLMGTMVEWLLTGAHWLLDFYVCLILLGIASFLLQLFLIYRHRLRKALDVGMEHSAAAFLFFFFAAAAGGFLAFATFGDAEAKEAFVLEYGVLALLGFASLLIVGQMYKIVPFLVWFHNFSDKAGREPVPMLKDMYSERGAEIELVILLLGILVLLAAIWFGLQGLLLGGFGLLLLGSLIFAYNIAAVFRIGKTYGDQRGNS